MKKVFIDPGHGGRDPGAVNPRLGISEAEINMAIAAEAVRFFSAAGFITGMARIADDTVSLEDRVRLAEQFKADVFLSFHCNSADNQAARGFEVFTSPGQTAADPIATEIFNKLRPALPGSPGRADYDDGDPDKEANFYVLRHTTMPAVLIEFEFISNDASAAKLATPGLQKTLALAVSRAILAHYAGPEDE